VTFYPSEFLRFRLAYKHTDRSHPFDAVGNGGSARLVDELLFQATFILGAHRRMRSKGAIMSKRLCALVLLIVAAVLIVSDADGARKLRVIATIPDLKALTEAVGGDLVEVDSLSRGTVNAHEIEIRPSMMLKLRRADIVVENGLELDKWIDVAVQGSNNDNIVRGGAGVIDVSRGIPVSRCRR